MSKSKILNSVLTILAVLVVAAFGPARAAERPVLRIAMQKDPVTNTVDPQREMSNIVNRIVHNIFDGLIGVDLADNFRLKPGLATSWERIDGRTLEVTLRRGVKFHDGTEMTAEDVAFTYSPERIMVESWPGRARMQWYWGGLERVDVIDSYKVRFVSKENEPLMEYRLAAVTSGVISKKAFEAAKSPDAWGRHPIGTGPYRVAEYKSGEVIVLEAFDDYWGGKPTARQIRWLIVPELAARVAGLVAGEYDIVTNIPPDQLANIDKYENLETVGGPVNNHHILVFDTQNEQLKEVKLRQALASAIDRKLIVDALWAGRTRVPNSYQWPEYKDMFDAERPMRNYDPELAKKLVEESSYKGEVIPFRIKNNYYTGEVARAQILVDMWSKVGINVKLEIKEKSDDLYGGIRNSSTTMIFPDPVAAFVRNWGPKGDFARRNVMANIDHEKFFSSATILTTSVDPEKRREAHREMLDFWDTQVPGFILHQNAIFYGKRKDIKWSPVENTIMELRPGALAFGT